MLHSSKQYLSDFMELKFIITFRLLNLSSSGCRRHASPLREYRLTQTCCENWPSEMLLWMILFMFPVVHFFLFFIMVHDLLFYATCTSRSCRPSSDRIFWHQFRSYACAPLRRTSSNMLATALRRDNSEKAKEIFSFLLPHRHLNCALRVHDFRYK